jgi:hypothetical protein
MPLTAYPNNGATNSANALEASAQSAEQNELASRCATTAIARTLNATASDTATNPGAKATAADHPSSNFPLRALARRCDGVLSTH